MMEHKTSPWFSCLYFSILCFHVNHDSCVWISSKNLLNTCICNQEAKANYVSIRAGMSRKYKISILVLSLAMGSNLRKILNNVHYPKIFLSFLNDKKKYIRSKENTILEFYQQFA